jgi:hypothetical protein
MSKRNTLFSLLTAGFILAGCAGAGESSREVREPRTASVCSCKARHTTHAHQTAVKDAQARHKNLR